jgi:hypothetical protein
MNSTWHFVPLEDHSKNTVYRKATVCTCYLSVLANSWWVDG